MLLNSMPFTAKRTHMSVWQLSEVRSFTCLHRLYSWEMFVAVMASFLVSRSVLRPLREYKLHLVISFLRVKMVWKSLQDSVHRATLFPQPLSKAMSLGFTRIHLWDGNPCVEDLIFKNFSQTWRPSKYAWTLHPRGLDWLTVYFLSQQFTILRHL